MLDRRNVASIQQPWIARVFAVLPAATIAITTWAWVSSGGVAKLADLSGAIRSIGLYAGLISSNLMVLQVLYLARIPWVERTWGHDVLAKRHRLLGFWSFWFLIAHLLLMTVARLKREQSLHALWTLFVTKSWMLLASMGTAMIIMVVITSIRASRRRLRYESWHLLHLYAYLGMALALPHQLFSGPHLHKPWEQAYWWGLYLVALAAILTFRVTRPLWISWYHRLHVNQVRQEVPGVVSITMSGKHLDKLRTRAGQFFIWRFLGRSGWTRGHPFTISAAPHPERFRITVQAVGDGSERACDIPVGSRVLIEGPYGMLTSDRRRHRRMVMIAAGVGITPFVGMLEDGDYGCEEVTVLYRVSQQDQAIHLDELRDYATSHGVRLHILSGSRREDSWLPDDKGDDEMQVLQELVPEIAVSDVFLCGPPMWNELALRSLARAGVSRRDIHIEDFSW